MQLTCMLKMINLANFLVDIFDTNTFFKIKEEMAGFPWWLSGKESACQCRRHRFDPWSGKIPCAIGQLSL